MRKIPVQGLVLPGGASDHNPFIKDLWYYKFPKAPPVRFCTFNAAKNDVGDKDRREDIDRVVARIMDFMPHVLGWQEVKRDDGIIEYLRNEGYICRWESPEFLVAAHRSRFSYVRHSGLIMSEHNYWLDQNEGLSVVWEDLEVNTELRATCTHPPAHIAQEKHPTFKNVLQVHEDVAKRMRQMGRNSMKQGIPWVDMRDSNIDPERDRPVGPYRSWAWAYPPPLTYVRAPSPTHGDSDRGRRIDEMNAVLMTVRPEKR